MTMAAVAPPPSSVAPPYPSWISKRKRSILGRRSSFSGRSSLRRLKLPPRAALVEAIRSSVVPALRDGSSSVKVRALPADQADDLQADAKAMSRSGNASVFSTQLLTDKYWSQPFKVLGGTVQILSDPPCKLLQHQPSLDLISKCKSIQTLKQIHSYTIKTGIYNTAWAQSGLCQGLSFRPDLFSHEYLEELVELQVLCSHL